MSKLKKSELKKRGWYVLVAAIAMVLGLGSRRYGSSLPEFLADHAGDVCWTSLVFCGFSMIAPNAKLLRRALLTLGFAYTIEFLQLYQAPWTNAIRQTTLGGLVLGFQFVWVDLVRYAIGVIVCVGGEYTVVRKPWKRLKDRSSSS